MSDNKKTITVNMIDSTISILEFSIMLHSVGENKRLDLVDEREKEIEVLKAIKARIENGEVIKI